ncbi:MAG: NUDIX hydrolase [Gleimia sp.]|jgi:8-oxo-dGTP pyrophosphatase MutT (NUDIX family)
MLDWDLEWEAAEFPVRVDSTSVVTSSGKPQKQYQVTVGDAAFAGAVAVVTARDTERMLLVRHERIRIGKTLWELPRGMADLDDPNPIATALRELHEETGIRATTGMNLGMIYPDSGFLTSEVAVVRIVIDHEGVATDNPDGEVEGHRWFTPEEIQALIKVGDMRDAISLGALAVVSANK